MNFKKFIWIKNQKASKNLVCNKNLIETEYIKQ